MESLKAFENWLWHQMIIQSTCGRYVSHGAVLKTLSKYAGVACCCREKCECERRFIKKVRTHISAKASTKLLAGAVASQGLHPLRRAQRPWQRKRWIQHPWYHERSRGVILKGREIKGFLDSGMAGIYEVKREPGHMVEHLSTAALDLAMLRAQSQHHRFGPDEKCLTS